MSGEKKFLVNVGMRDMPFPLKVVSKTEPEGQTTIANISIEARIMQEFEARWIDRFIQIVHKHHERLGTKTIGENILDYMEALKAKNVRIDFDYPFFIEKTTPVSKEKCLVKYQCTYSARVSTIEEAPKIIFKMNIPCITTYPASDIETKGGLFAQLSILTVEIESKDDIYPEDLVDLVDKHSLSPVYSFLTEEDQLSIIHKAHSEKKTSVVVIDHIKSDLAHNRKIEWYAVRASNYGMLHSYNTFIGTEKGSWIPFSGYDE